VKKRVSHSAAVAMPKVASGRGRAALALLLLGSTALAACEAPSTEPGVDPGTESPGPAAPAAAAPTSPAPGNAPKVPAVPPADAGGASDAQASDAGTGQDAQLPGGDGPFREIDGVIAIEGAKVATGWSSKTDIPGFTGTGYYEATADQSAGGKGLLQYRIAIEHAGNYEFRWRSRIAVGQSSTESNDSFVRFPTGTNVAAEWPLSGWTKTYMNRTGAWAWQTVTKDHDPRAIRQNFTAGDHTIEVSVRSAGHAIDRLVLFKYDTVTFNEAAMTTHPLSPRL
jgi:hypothetical protein